ncbi:hypothetical protein H0H87_005208 [Tephrocybe sp. NHM501043]|nr:hypothetical protein H0H87_005208 [Tephrocybe sp. NHM501043]
MFEVLGWNLPVLALCSASAYLVALGFYRLFLHPLARFPGPRWAAVSDLYSAYYDLVLKGALVDHLEELHKIYGPVVRFGPEQKLEYYYQVFNKESTFGYIDPTKAKQRKDIVRPLFSRKAILKLENVIQSSIDQLLTAILSHDRSSPVNLYLGFLSTTMEVITTYCFARSYGVVSFPHFQHPTLIAFESTGLIFHVMQHFPFTMPLIKGMPTWLARILSPEAHGYGLLIADLTSQIDALLADPTALDRAEQETIYHHLLNGEDDVQRPSRSSLIDEAATMVSAGSETVGKTCALGTFHVLDNPEVCEKLVNELRGAWPDVEMTVGLEILERLPYLVRPSPRSRPSRPIAQQHAIQTAVIKESLRMTHGVVSPAPRVVPSPTFIAGAGIPANAVVSMGAIFMHHNPEIFPKPLEFRPERWLDRKNPQEMEQFLVPFSKGPRSCLGVNLAWAELYLLFANVFRKVDMEIHDTT